MHHEYERQRQQMNKYAAQRATKSRPDTKRATEAAAPSRSDDLFVFNIVISIFGLVALLVLIFSFIIAYAGTSNISGGPDPHVRRQIVERELHNNGYQNQSTSDDGGESDRAEGSEAEASERGETWEVADKTPETSQISDTEIDDEKNIPESEASSPPPIRRRASPRVTAPAQIHNSPPPQQSSYDSNNGGDQLLAGVLGFGLGLLAGTATSSVSSSSSGSSHHGGGGNNSSWGNRSGGGGGGNSSARGGSRIGGSRVL